jgi:hypothetical protein
MPDEKCYQEKVYELEKQVAVLYQKAIDGDKALVVALNDLGRRLDEMNQFRAQLNEERGRYVTIPVFDAKHEELIKKVDLLVIAKSNLDGRMWMLGWVIMATSGALTVAINLIFKWVNK